MDFKLIKYSPVYLSSLTKLLNESFFIENKNKEQLVSWKYFDPFLKDGSITYLALDNNQNVISHYTNIPLTVSFKDKIYKTLVCTDMATDSLYRGQGLISKLSTKVYQDVHKKRYDFSLGFSNDQGVKVDKYSINYGYIIVGKFVRYFKLILYKKKTEYDLVKVNKFNFDVYNKESSYLKFKKDKEYLYWRYLKKPNPEYDTYSVNDEQKVIGYVVLRFLGFKCYVYDLIFESDDPKFIKKILRSIENKSLEKGSRVIIYNVLDNSYWKNIFNKYKYFKKTNTSVNYYLTIKNHNNNLNKEYILNNENWLLMYGDIL